MMLQAASQAPPSQVMNPQQITGIAIKIALIREGKDIKPTILADLIKYSLVSSWTAVC
jgi:hypothetical protein